MRSTVLVIDKRFCGPPRSGNGGYACGRLGNLLLGCCKVRLKAPPPLDVELRAETMEREARLFDGSALIAQAQLSPLDLLPPPAPSFAEASDASLYMGFKDRVFPGCFVCGPQRAAGDGLRIFPGAMPTRSLVAAPWIPDASLDDGSGNVLSEFIWAALDCTSGFSLPPLPKERARPLGELSVRVDGAIATGEKCVVVGWALGADGRKHFAGSALYSEAGHAVAVGRATWIELPRAAVPVN